MTPNMLPVSTAMWDPKWFHANKNENYRYMDKNGVINGIRMNTLCMDMYRMEKLVKNNQSCDFCNPNGGFIGGKKPMCAFMREYAECIRHKNPNFQKFLSFCEGYLQFINSSFNLTLDTIVFIVHEAPSRPCGERPVLIQWFQENGMELSEWSNK